MLKRRGADAEVELLLDAYGTVLGDPVGDVHQPDRPEGKARVGHQGHVQRKGEHVQVGGGELLAHRHRAHGGVGGEVRRIDPHPGELELEIGHLAAAAGEKGSSELPGSSGAAARA